MLRARIVLPAMALVLACYSGARSDGDDDGDDDGGSGDDAATVEGGDDDDDGGDDGPQSSCTAPPQRVNLLSNRRYGHAVRDLLGLAVAPEPTTAGGTHNDLLPPPPELNGGLVYEYNDLAHAAADEALANLDTLAPCSEGDDELACAAAFIDDFGARAFRRPLTDEERDGLLAVWQVGRDQDETYEGGIRLVIVSLLQSPTFLYITELGTPDEDGAYVLDPWEVATQISFFLLDSIPDAELRAAAADGRLATNEGVTEQVDRLLALPEGRANVTGIVLRWLRSDRVLEVEKQDPVFTAELRESLRAETELFVDDLLWNGDADLQALLTSQDTFVDARLAELYGVPMPPGDGFTKVTLPAEQRMGVLTHGSVLASLSGVAETSVVFRGLFVARDLLCMDFPAPPPGAAEDGLDDAVGERARAEHRMTTLPCSGCHATFDPFGLLFEHYDALGRYRTTIGDAPVDASWDIEQPASIAGHAETFVEFAPRLAAADEVATCAAQRVATYAAQRQIDADLACHTNEIAAQFEAADRDLVELVRLVAVSSVLRMRSAAEDP
jgi:hypothetical protein